jgi:hypothetical protein
MFTAAPSVLTSTRAASAARTFMDSEVSFIPRDFRLDATHYARPSSSDVAGTSI